jgi:hypothetical protein
MAVSSVTRANAVSGGSVTLISERRHARIVCNRREDYLRRIAAAQGNPRLQISHATDAVRAASKDLPAPVADRVVVALLSLAGLGDDPELNAAAARLLELAARRAAA